MKLIALCGAAGAGKDTVADMLPARKLAFADTLYREVAEAYRCDIDELKDRDTKEVPQMWLTGIDCEDMQFRDYLWGVGVFYAIEDDCRPCSPRQILQWWGDYRRAQDLNYFVKAAARTMLDVGYDGWVITDVRFPNEAAMVRQLGGQIWQIKRPGYEAGGTGHASDTAGDEFWPDRVVVNGGSVEDLRAVVLAAWEGSV